MKKQLIFRKITALVMTLIMVSQMSLAVFANEDTTNTNIESTTTAINFQKEINSQNSVNKNGRILAQVSQFLPSWYSAKWDQSTKTMTIQYDDTIVTVKVGSKYITKNKNGNIETITTDQPAQVINGRTLLPLKTTAQALELNLSYNNNTKTAIVQKSSDGSITTITPPPPSEAPSPSTNETPQGVITNASDLKVLNSKRFKTAVVDGVQIPIYHLPSKQGGPETAYFKFTDLKKALKTWDMVGVYHKSDSNRIHLDSIAPRADNEYGDIIYDKGIAMSIFINSGKVFRFEEYMFYIEPLPKIGGSHAFKVTDFISLYKLDATIENDVLKISTRNRGNINDDEIRFPVQEQRDFLKNPDLTVKEIGLDLEPRPILNSLN